MSEQAKCGLCGEPMPPGEEMFQYHGYSGPCPKPPLQRPQPVVIIIEGKCHSNTKDEMQFGLNKATLVSLGEGWLRIEGTLETGKWACDGTDPLIPGKRYRLTIEEIE